MQRFILEQNVARFERLLQEEKHASTRETLIDLLSMAQRQLALLVASSSGASPYPLEPVPEETLHSDANFRLFEREFESAMQPILVLDPRPGLRIVDANAPYTLATLTQRSALLGHFLFDAFPDNPADADATGVSNLFASIQTAVRTGRPHRMAVQRYDIRDDHGHFVERYWQPINTPIFNERQQLIYIAHSVEDVTAELRRMQDGEPKLRSEE